MEDFFEDDNLDPERSREGSQRAPTSYGVNPASLAKIL